MTRRDFQLIAGTLAAVRASYSPTWDPNLFRACNDHAHALADALAGTNPRFDRERFLDACGVPRDTESSASRQHYIDTGRYLHYGESL